MNAIIKPEEVETQAGSIYIELPSDKNISKVKIDTKYLHNIDELSLVVGRNKIFKLTDDHLIRYFPSRYDFCDFTSQFISYIPVTCWRFQITEIFVKFKEQYLTEHLTRTEYEYKHVLKKSGDGDECDYRLAGCGCCASDCVRESHYMKIPKPMHIVNTPELICEFLDGGLYNIDAVEIPVHQPILLSEVLTKDELANFESFRESSTFGKKIIGCGDGLGFYKNILRCKDGLAGPCFTYRTLK